MTTSKFVDEVFDEFYEFIIRWEDHRATYKKYNLMYDFKDNNTKLSKYLKDYVTKPEITIHLKGNFIMIEKPWKDIPVIILSFKSLIYIKNNTNFDILKIIFFFLKAKLMRIDEIEMKRQISTSYNCFIDNMLYDIAMSDSSGSDSDSDFDSVSD
jgi:hypothetical protein